MLAITLSWSIISFVCLLWGKLTISFLDKWVKQKHTKAPMLDCFFVGMASIGVLCSAVSLFAPVNVYLLAVVVVITIVIAILQRTWLLARVTEFIGILKRLPTLLKIILAVVSFSILLLALCTPLMFDMGLYHIQSMMWTQEYSVVPGLGNLHGRLAFNSNFLLLSTLFNFHPNYFEPFFSINSLAMVAFSTWVILKINERKLIAEKAILAIILIASIFSFSMYLSTSSTDIITHIIIFYILLSIILDGKVKKSREFSIVIIAAFCITLKLSSALIILVPLWILIKKIIRKDYKTVYTGIAIGFLIAIPWLARFVLLSGYLIYPFPAIDIFSFDWKIPLEAVQMEKDLAFVWPIAPHLPVEEVLSMSFTKWVPLWIKQQSIFNLAFYALALISPLALIFAKLKSKLSSTVSILWMISITASIFAFISAPDPRFSFAFILLSGLIPIYALAPILKTNAQLNKIFYILCIIPFLWLAKMSYTQLTHYQGSESIWELALKPQSIEYKKNEINLRFDEFITDQDIIIYAPIGGMQCFDHELPCTPYYNEYLELRGNNLRDGFKTKAKK